MSLVKIGAVKTIFFFGT